MNRGCSEVLLDGPAGNCVGPAHVKSEAMAVVRTSRCQGIGVSAFSPPDVRIGLVGGQSRDEKNPFLSRHIT